MQIKTSLSNKTTDFTVMQTKNCKKQPLPHLEANAFHQKYSGCEQVEHDQLQHFDNRKSSMNAKQQTKGFICETNDVILLA